MIFYSKRKVIAQNFKFYLTIFCLICDVCNMKCSTLIFYRDIPWRLNSLLMSSYMLQSNPYALFVCAPLWVCQYCRHRTVLKLPMVVGCTRSCVAKPKSMLYINTLDNFVRLCTCRNSVMFNARVPLIAFLYALLREKATVTYMLHFICRCLMRRYPVVWCTIQPIQSHNLTVFHIMSCPPEIHGGVLCRLPCSSVYARLASSQEFHKRLENR